MNKREQTLKIRQQLKRSWNCFFGGFGKLTPVQLATIPNVLANMDVIIASPTASGKTEAIVAPVAEKHLTEKWQGLAVVYIVPTRALANDMIERLAGSLEEIGIKIVLKHGDKPQMPVKLPDWLVTTPESLDSLICRKPQIFETLRVVVIDEIHLLDNTYRGDQLRLLLYRLRQLSHFSLSTHLLSATIADGKGLVIRYLVNKYEIICVSGQREIEYYFLRSHEEIINFSKTNKWYKLLYFCNKRESVEKIAHELTPLWKPYPVVAHHGMLARKEREDAEETFKSCKIGICVATSTLEIGIDVGNIDAVVLAEPPWSVSSLLQRIGRSNRRSHKTIVINLIQSDAEKELLTLMFNVASSGKLPIDEYLPDLSVVVQQLFSYLFQNQQGVLALELEYFLSQLATITHINLIIERLLEKGWIEKKISKYYPSSKLLDDAEKGKIHSNIPDQTKYSVINIENGKDIGFITGNFDSVFILSGLAWQIVSIQKNTIKVCRFNGHAKSVIFKLQRNVGAYYFLLPDKLKKP